MPLQSGAMDDARQRMQSASRRKHSNACFRDCPTRTQRSPRNTDAESFSIARPVGAPHHREKQIKYRLHTRLRDDGIAESTSQMSGHQWWLIRLNRTVATASICEGPAGGHSTRQSPLYKRRRRAGRSGWRRPTGAEVRVCDRERATYLVRN
jgi:hypothetical protein